MLALIMELPGCIRIGAFDVTVRVHAPPWSDNEKSFGEFDCNPPSIGIASDIRCPVYAAAVLRHEINHAIFHAYGLSDCETEERVVDVMANAWVQIERDNPALVAWFSAARAAASRIAG